MRSWRVLLRDVAIDGVGVEASYADLFLVVREAEEVPGPNDWEATLRTAQRRHLTPGRHELRAHTEEGQEVLGWAVLRFSDGNQHHFRGDGPLDGAGSVLA